MQTRRLRPVAALTLALVAAPFLAATAVAAQAAARTPETAPTRVTWLADTTASITSILDRIDAATAQQADTPPAAKAAPARPAAESAPAPPPPPAVTDPTTWLWPAVGPITSPFGARWGRAHQGVDIDGAFGSVVVAAQRGTVTVAGWGQRGYGRVVHVDHGHGLVSTYSHLDAISVVAGQVVERGSQVGTLGASGSVTAAHLHYEIHVNGVPQNPAGWLTSPMSVAGNPG